MITESNTKILGRGTKNLGEKKNLLTKKDNRES
jgi:hypothetical protein